MAETAGGGILASLRDHTWPTNGVRGFSRSSDGGRTWSATFFGFTNPPVIPDPSCQGSILRLGAAKDGKASALVHANAADPVSRSNMVLRVSFDDGHSWPVSNQVYSGRSAYSALAPLADGAVGLLFESDGYERIDFTRQAVFKEKAPLPAAR